MNKKSILKVIAAIGMKSAKIGCNSASAFGYWLSPAERTEGSAESEEVKQSNFRFHIEVIILFALNMYVQDLGLGRRKVTSLRNTYEYSLLI